MAGMLSEGARPSSDAAPAVTPTRSAVFAIIAATAFAAIIPMFWFGNVSGHDFEFHMNSWMEVGGQWHEGTLYPSWAAMAHYGHGEARFIFYPPASWVFGAALGKLLPWTLVPGVYIWVVLTAAGCSMFVLARNWLPRWDAVFAAALYAVNPYHLLIVYWRSAFAELMASIWLPLLLLLVLRLGRKEDRRKTMLGLSLVLAGAWLTNAPAAVMINYSLVLLVCIVALVRRAPKVILYGAVACLLGVGLAGFYVLPAAFEERWVNINDVLTLIVRPQSNFLFTRIPDPDHNRFNLLVSILATLEIVTLAVAMWLSRKRRSEHPEFWWSLTVWGSVAALLMLPFTFILWQYLPQLRFVQLPWRWLLCLNVSFVLLVTMGMRGWRSRGAVCVVMLAGLLVVWTKIQRPWWDKAADIADLVGDTNEGYEGVDEYVPREADPSLAKPGIPLVVVADGGASEVRIENWATQTRRFTVVAEKPGEAIVCLFNYPAWHVEVNDQQVIPETQPDTGLMVIPVQPGRNKVEVTFVRTRDRVVGAGLSGATGVLMILLAVWRKRD